MTDTLVCVWTRRKKKVAVVPLRVDVIGTHTVLLCELPGHHDRLKSTRVCDRRTRQMPAIERDMMTDIDTEELQAFLGGWTTSN